MDKPNPKTPEKASEPKVALDIRKALAAVPGAGALWRDLTPIARRDFILWIDTAKQAETRSRRIERLCDMLLTGKRRPCCFSVVPFDLYKALAAHPKAKAKWGELASIPRRDFISWIDVAKEREARKCRVEQACAMIAAGKRRP